MPSASDPFDDTDETDNSLIEDTPDCWTHVVTVEVENIDPSKPPILHDVEVRANKILSLDSLSPAVEAEVGPWLGILSNYADFTARFGTSQTWSVIGVGIFRGC